MHSAFFCRDRFYGLDGIHEPASLDHACVRGKNMGDGRRDSPALLSIARSRNNIDAWRFSGDAAGVSFGGAHFLAGAALDDSRGAASRGRVGSLARIPLANRGPGVDLCAVDGLHPIPIFGEFHQLTSYAQDTLARHNVRAYRTGTNPHYLALKRIPAVEVREVFHRQFSTGGSKSWALSRQIS